MFLYEVCFNNRGLIIYFELYECGECVCVCVRVILQHLFCYKYLFSLVFLKWRPRVVYTEALVNHFHVRHTHFLKSKNGSLPLCTKLDAHSLCIVL